MPAKSSDWLERIKTVEVEYLVAKLAIDRLRSAVQHDPTLLRPGIKPRNVKEALRNLEGTYVIRLFAQFEAGLRQFWRAQRGNRPPARTRDLLDGIAATCRIYPRELASAHAAREYRNALIHERDESLVPVTLALVRQALCRFFAFLPPEW